MASHTRRPWVIEAYGRQPRTPCKNRKEYGGLPVNSAHSTYCAPRATSARIRFSTRTLTPPIPSNRPAPTSPVKYSKRTSLLRKPMNSSASVAFLWSTTADSPATSTRNPSAPIAPNRHSMHRSGSADACRGVDSRRDGRADARPRSLCAWLGELVSARWPDAHRTIRPHGPSGRACVLGVGCASRAGSGRIPGPECTTDAVSAHPTP